MPRKKRKKIQNKFLGNKKCFPYYKYFHVKSLFLSSAKNYFAFLITHPSPRELHLFSSPIQVLILGKKCYIKGLEPNKKCHMLLLILHLFSLKEL